MAVLTVGRVGLTASVVVPEDVSDDASRGRRRLRITGTLLGATLAESKALRDELVALAELEGVIPFTWDEDPNFDGFYHLDAAQVDLRSLSDRGFLPYSLTLERVGTSGDVAFRSKITGTVAQNDHGVTAAEAEPFHAPPRTAVAYDPGATVPSFVTRTGPSGGIRVYRDVDYTVDPWWTATPAGFYDAAARISTGNPSFLRAGVTHQPTPQDWTLENELVRVTPNGTGGRIDVEHHDGTQWDPAVTWRIQSGGADVGAWDTMRILRNTAEETTIRLTRDVSTGGQITLDLSLRRGSRFVTAYLTRHASATLKVVLASAAAGTTVTPTGASSAVAVRRTSALDGNRPIVGSARSFTADTTNTGLSKAATTTLDFFLGSEVGGSGAQAGDQAADLCLQYLGVITEDVVAVPR